MPEKEVISPVTRKGSKVGSNQPLSPGARSDPGRVDSVSSQPNQGPPKVSRNSAGPAEARITGPED
jgi:hypothetical protein